MKLLSHLACALALAIGGIYPAQAEEVGTDAWGNPMSSVDLGKVGKTTLELQAGKHRAAVIFTVAPKPRDWPDMFIVGPTADDTATGEVDDIVTSVDIRVDGCLVEQPWPEIGGMSAATQTGAMLTFEDNRWKLHIGGGDGAESYGVDYVFDAQRILSRELLWGPDYREKTRYGIDVDRDVSPRQCEDKNGELKFQ